jgi:hypothetical protein
MGFCREGDELVAWKLNRFGRSVRELIDPVNALRERGTDFVASWWMGTDIVGWPVTLNSDVDTTIG